MAVRYRQYGLAALLIAAGGAAGALYGFHSIRFGAASGEPIHNGVWVTDPTLASAESSARTRAYLAVVGLLGLPKSEAIYFQTGETEKGEPIDSDHVYEIVGRDLPGRWWSLTLYDADQFLTPNAHHRYSVRGSDLERGADGRYRILLSRDPRPGNWIPTGEGHDMSLALRIYDPDPTLADALASTQLPTVRRIGGEP